METMIPAGRGPWWMIFSGRENLAAAHTLMCTAARAGCQRVTFLGRQPMITSRGDLVRAQFLLEFAPSIREPRISRINPATIGFACASARRWASMPSPSKFGRSSSRSKSTKSTWRPRWEWTFRMLPRPTSGVEDQDRFLISRTTQCHRSTGHAAIPGAVW